MLLSWGDAVSFSLIRRENERRHLHSFLSEIHITWWSSCSVRTSTVDGAGTAAEHHVSPITCQPQLAWLMAATGWLTPRPWMWSPWLVKRVVAVMVRRSRLLPPPCAPPRRATLSRSASRSTEQEPVKPCEWLPYANPEQSCEARVLRLLGGSGSDPLGVPEPSSSPRQRWTAPTYRGSAWLCSWHKKQTLYIQIDDSLVCSRHIDIC